MTPNCTTHPNKGSSLNPLLVVGYGEKVGTTTVHMGSALFNAITNHRSLDGLMSRYSLPRIGNEDEGGEIVDAFKKTKDLLGAKKEKTVILFHIPASLDHTTIYVNDETGETKTNRLIVKNVPVLPDEQKAALKQADVFFSTKSEAPGSVNSFLREGIQPVFLDRSEHPENPAKNILRAITRVSALQR